jgi:16S rRNA A1518/A1519 N6-dimethyltransferase RsmA/KsgA/DIM1 with predicted DNA glycosylase/AP lyase activity
MDKEYIEINRKAYSIFADEYYEKMLKENRYKDITDKLCKYVYDAYINANNGKKPESVLELGPGLGATLLLFSTTYNCNVTGVELSNRMAD